MENILNVEIEKLQTIAEKLFSPKNSKKVEVLKEPSLLTVRIYKKNGLEGWFSLIEIKRFYENCQNENLVNFRFPWELTSLSLENKDFTEIYFHLD